MILSGVAGIGKTTLLKKLSRLIPSDTYKDGIYWFSAYGLELDDLLQCLFSAFYTSNVAFKPGRAQIQIALQEVQALILIDDLELVNDEIQIVLDLAPNCMFVVASTMQVLQSESETVQLGGLPDNESLNLFEQKLGRPLADEERQLVSEICQLLQGHPETIGLVATKVREEGLTIDATISKLKNNPPESLFLDLFQSLPQIEQEILSVLAVVEGRILPQEHILALLPSKETKKALKDLTTRGLIQAHSPAYSLSQSLSGALTQSLGLAPWEEVVIKYFIEWLAQRPADQFVEEIQDTLLTLVKKAGKEENWPWVIKLGRAFEQILILRGYWQTWNEILNLILEAGRALGDRKLEGWALHQLGSRSLCLGEKEQAENLLKQALSIRRSIGDQVGIKLTQHNLSIITGVPPTGGLRGGGGGTIIPLRPLLYIMVGVGAIAITGLSVLAGLFFYRPSPPRLIQPENEYVGQTSTIPDFQWRKVLNGATYQIQVDDQQDFSSTEYDFTAATNIQAPDIVLNQGIYYWRVRAISRFNKVGNWSETWKFTISIPPEKPTLSNPADKDIETKPEILVFTWKKVDNSTYYLVQIDDTDNFNSPESEKEISKNSFSPPTVLTQGTYYWRVRAFNEYDTPSEWSSTWQFVVSIPPEAPTLSLPISGYKETTTTKPTFEWNSVENSEIYQIQVDDNQDFNSPEYEDNTSETDRTPSTSFDQGVYYWRVRAFNTYDTPGDWSSTWKFTISIPPATPILLSPADDYLEETTTKPLFEWKSAQNAASYQIQIDNNQSFNSVEYENETENTSRNSTTDLTQGDYYWRVRAFNAYDTPGDWSNTWKFTISIPPQAPKLTAPSDKAKIETTNRPTFDWQSVTNTVQYQIQVDNSNSFSTPVYDDTVTNTSRKPSQSFSQGIYYWRVQAINKYGTPGKWSSTWQFIISTPPGTPTLLDPSNGSVVGTAKPNFKWGNTSNADYYQLEVDNNSGFSSPAYNRTVSGTSRTINVSLSLGKYYWRVRAFNTYDTPGKWSSIRQFTVNIPPGTPTLLEPSNASVVVITTKPSFKWGSATNAEYYQLEVDNSSSFSSPAYNRTVSGTSRTINVSLSLGKYYWRVRAFNIYDTPGKWSSPRIFYVSIPPGTPTLWYPPNGSPISSQPTFAWHSATNASYYRIQVDDNSGFTSPEINSTTSLTQTTRNLSPDPNKLLCGTHTYTFYWRVRAYSKTNY